MDMSSVLCMRDLPEAALAGLLAPWGLQPVLLGAGEEIPGSFWGAPEAGLIGNWLYVRPDTPVHSALHEACHYICMDDARRRRLHTDAGGDALEECAVCYLQILLADRLPGVGRERLMRDMDAWGYSFRLGSARRWFLEDAGDARDWLVREGLIEPTGSVTGRLRAGRAPQRCILTEVKDSEGGLP